MNTAAKRRSMLSFGIPGLNFMAPNGAIDKAERQTLTGVYGGIALGELVEPEISGTLAVVNAVSSCVQPAVTRI